MQVDDLSEESVGALFAFMQMTICFVGLIFGIDAFSQPAVEELKINIHKLIG
jgi:glucose-6-phosphate isomerase